MKKTLITALCALLALCFPFAALAGEREDPLLTLAPAEGPVVNAPAYLLMDANTGTVLCAKNEHEKHYPASVTKVMSLLLICEAIRDGRLDPEAEVACSVTAAEKGGSQIWLEPGETMTVRELLCATVVGSANDACALLAEQVAGSEAAFTARMNERAAALGMADTYFDNCTGLDDDTSAHLTSAYDVALMSRALLGIDLIRAYTTVWMDTLRGGKTQLVNTNRLIRYYAGATGLKTGTTSKAGCCISATAERDGLSLIAVVLGAENSAERFAGARALLDYGFANYEIFRPRTDRAALVPVRVLHGTADCVNVACGELAELLVDRGAAASVGLEIELLPEIEAPVEAGDRLGTLRLVSGGAALAEYPLTAAEPVPRLTVLRALLRIIGSAAGRAA